MWQKTKLSKEEGLGSKTSAINIEFNGTELVLFTTFYQKSILPNRWKFTSSSLVTFSNSTNRKFKIWNPIAIHEISSYQSIIVWTNSTTAQLWNMLRISFTQAFLVQTQNWTFRFWSSWPLYSCLTFVIPGFQTFSPKPYVVCFAINPRRLKPTTKPTTSPTTISPTGIPQQDITSYLPCNNFSYG